MGISITYLVKCFCFAAFSFCVTGVIRLSVGETNLGLLERTREQGQHLPVIYAFVYLLGLCHLFG